MRHLSFWHRKKEKSSRLKSRKVRAYFAVALGLLFLINVLGPPIFQLIPSKPVLADTVQGYAYTDSSCKTISTQETTGITGGTQTVNIKATKNGVFTGSYVVSSVRAGAHISLKITLDSGTYDCSSAATLSQNGVQQGHITITDPTTVIKNPGGGSSTTQGLTGKWVDHSDLTVNINGTIYNFHDSDSTDGNNNYHIQYPPNSCANGDVINSWPGGDTEHADYATSSGVKITLYTQGTGNNLNCSHVTVHLALDSSTADNYNIYFKWVDAGTISTSDGSRVTFAAGTPATTFLDDGNGKTSSKTCISQMTVSSIGASAGNLKWYASDDKESGVKNLPHWPSKIAGSNLYVNDSNGCSSTNNINVQIADPFANGVSGALASTLASGSGGSGGGSGDDSNTAPTLDCHVSILNPLSWFLCPLATGLESVAGGLDNLIQGELDFNSDNLNSYQTAFNSIRDLSLGLIGVGALVAIVSQAAGLEILDAYTIRKILPRIFICAIGIALAWPLLKFFINLTDGLGAGIRQIIYLGAGGAKAGQNSAGAINLGGGAATVENILAGGAILSLGFVGLLSFAATAALAAAVAFLVLILRQMVITVLVIFAPFAIAAFLLPNTNKVWKLWWDSFSKGLLMFPIIAALIAVGRVLATTTSDNILAFVAYFAPYFLLPFTFKLAGGAIGTLGGMVNDRSRGAFDGLRNFRGNTIKRRRHNATERAQSGNIFRNAPEGSRRNALNSGVQNATLLGSAGMNPTKMRRNIQAARASSQLAHAMEGSEKNQAFQIVKGNDDLLAASVAGRGTMADARAYLESRGMTGRDLEQNLGHIEAAKKSMGAHGFGIAAAIANAGTGTGYAGGPGEMLAAINRASGGDMALAGNMLAQARGRAEGARRFDLAGAGFGDGYGQLQAINRAMGSGQTEQAIQDANDHLTDRALESQGAGAMLAGRGNSVANLIPAINRRLNRSVNAVHDTHAELQTAQAGGDAQAIADAQTAHDDAQRGYRQTLASTAGLLDVASQVSPENAKMLADGVMQRTLTDGVSGQSATVGQVVEMFRSDRQFGEMRREYGANTQQQYDAARRAMGNPAQGPGTIPPLPI